MYLSYISVLLLAPLSLASPTPSSNAISINQRDVSTPLASRTQLVSQKINNVVDEGHKVTEMCQKYKGGVFESIHLYRQFKTCYSSVQSAEKAASQSESMSEGESANVEAALQRLTPEFLEISEALQKRVSFFWTLPRFTLSLSLSLHYDSSVGQWTMMVIKMQY